MSKQTDLTALTLKLEIACDTLKEIADALDGRTCAHACTGADCGVCAPGQLIELARGALALIEDA